MSAMYQDPALVELFTTYTAAPDSIGAQLADALADRGRHDPLIAATSSDVVLYPGGGRPPQVEGFRLSTRGFKELAGISHLGPAVASLVALRELRGDDGWRPAAHRLLTAVDAARAASSVELWRDRIAVDAYRGHEPAIVDMIDYTCAATSEYVRAALDDPSRLCAAAMRSDYLERAPIPVDHAMVATFFLVGLDIAHRLVRWFGTLDLDWERAMVVVAGQHGRPTAGVTWNTSTVATIIRGASGGRLPMDRMLLAPHAPTVPSPTGDDLGAVAALEEPLRRVWFRTRASMELAEPMFSGYPRFVHGELRLPDVADPAVTEVTEMPAVHGPDDMRALVTRLRVVLEDPRQLLSGCVTDEAVARLLEAGNDPSRVVVPGLTGVAYPPARGSR